MAHPNHSHLKTKKGSKKHRGNLDTIVYFFAFGAPIFELPQLYTIYSEKSAQNVSPFTWGFFTIASFFWLMYGIKHKIKPVIISYTMFFIFELITFLGILYYR